MGLTQFPYGITSFGIPITGGNTFRGMWGKKVYFVDPDNGSSDGGGLTPDDAIKYLDVVLPKLADGDAVLIRQDDLSATATDFSEGGLTPLSATANYEIPYGRTDIALIGANNFSGTDHGEVGAYRTYLKGASAVTDDPVLDIKAGAVVVENISFGRGGLTSAPLVRVYGGSDTANNAYGVAFSNCLFRQFAYPYPALHVLDAWYVDVNGCWFYNCEQGIVVQGSSSTNRSTSIRNSVFKGTTAIRDIDILVTGSSSTFTLIDGCLFMDDKPAHSGGSYGNFLQVTSGDGMISRCYACNADMAATTDYTIAASTVLIVGCEDASGNNWGV